MTGQKTIFLGKKKTLFSLAKRRARKLNKRFAEQNFENYPQVAILAFDYIGLTINLDGRFEKEALEITRSFLAEYLHFDFSGICLDIGANIGNHALFFAKSFRHVYAFEPNPRIFNLLEFNSYNQNITPLNYGLSDKDGSLNFKINKKNWGASFITEGSLRDENTIVVDVRRLDAEKSIPLSEVSLMKIDVEGHEAKVLKGAEYVIKTSKPVIIFEQFKDEFSCGSSDVVDLLKGHAYEFFIVDTNFNFGKSFSSRALALLLRFIFGKRKVVKRINEFESKYHETIIAVHSGSVKND